MSPENFDSELIDAYGGTTEVARLCGLTTGAISQWRTNGIPKSWRAFLKLAKPKIYRGLTSRSAQVRPAEVANV